MINGFNLRLEDENRRLRALVYEMQAILEEAAQDCHRVESAQWWNDVYALFRKAQDLGITL